MASRVGQQLGNYRLTNQLGEGGFAEVYLGEHIFLKTQAAIKVLKVQLNEKDLQGFLQEAQTIAEMRHNNIVRMLEFGIESNTPFLIMEYASRGSLRQRHPPGIRLTLDTTITYVKQVAAALNYSHSKTITHCDIKPENMLVTNDGQVIISDFGLAVITRSTASQKLDEVAGTVQYMAPEQFQGKPRPTSDQYALAVTVYEWLCGTPPFSEGNFIQLAYQQNYVLPPSLRAKNPAIPPLVEQVVLKALAKDPAQRFPTVQDFAIALEQAARVMPYPPFQVPQPTPFYTIPQQSVIHRPIPQLIPRLSPQQPIKSASPAYLPLVRGKATRRDIVVIGGYSLLMLLLLATPIIFTSASSGIGAVCLILIIPLASIFAGILLGSWRGMLTTLIVSTITLVSIDLLHVGFSNLKDIILDILAPTLAALIVGYIYEQLKISKWWISALVILLGSIIFGVTLAYSFIDNDTEKFLAITNIVITAVLVGLLTVITFIFERIIYVITAKIMKRRQRLALTSH